jgi:hypothetical protein
LLHPDAIKAALLMLTRKIKFDYDDKLCTDTRHYEDDEKLITTMFRRASEAEGFCAYLAALKLLDNFANKFHRSTPSVLLAGLGHPATGMSCDEASFPAAITGHGSSKKHVAFTPHASGQIREVEMSIIGHYSSQAVFNLVIKALDAAKAGTLSKPVKLPPVPYSSRVGVWRLTGNSRQVRPPDLVNASLTNRPIRQRPPQSRTDFRHDIRNVFRGSDHSCLYQAPYAPVQGQHVDGDEEGEEDEAGGSDDVGLDDTVHEDGSNEDDASDDVDGARSDEADDGSS